MNIELNINIFDENQQKELDQYENTDLRLLISNIIKKAFYLEFGIAEDKMLVTDIEFNS